MIEHAKRENDGHGIPIETLAQSRKIQERLFDAIYKLLF